jgi:hypothetical protein
MGGLVFLLRVVAAPGNRTGVLPGDQIRAGDSALKPREPGYYSV